MHRSRLTTLGISSALAWGALPKLSAAPAVAVSDEPKQATSAALPASSTKAPTLEEMMEVGNLPALHKLYGRYGRGEDDMELLTRLQRDFYSARKALLEQISAQPEFAEPLVVEVGDETYVIHGIAHIYDLLEKYQSHFSEALEGHATLSEQGLSPYAGGRAIELADHAVWFEGRNHDPVRQFFWGFCQRGWDERRILGEGVYQEHPVLDDSVVFSMIADCSNSRAELCTLLGSFPAAVGWKSLPTPLTLELKSRWRMELNQTEARSAYMAEVLRRWKRPNEKHIVVGAEHQSEISYFLKHPTNDPGIIALASEHAAILNNARVAQPLLDKQYPGMWSWYNAGDFAAMALVSALTGTIAGTSGAWILIRTQRRRAQRVEG